MYGYTARSLAPRSKSIRYLPVLQNIFTTERLLTMNRLAGIRAKDLTQRILKDLPKSYVPPSAGTIPRSQMVIPHSLIIGTRGYIEKVVFQINGCYEYGWYDGCAVMMRRLVETMIIECFESFSISDRIKDTNGDFLHLADLIRITLKESTWNLSRNARKSLNKLKDIGDLSAHNRRFIALREDIDKIQHEFRQVIQEMTFMAGLR